MKQKDFNEAFDMMHNEVMDKAKELFTELFKRAMLARAIAMEVAPSEVETWEQLKDWVMLSDFQNVAEVTRFFIGLIDSADDYRDLPEQFEDIFTVELADDEIIDLLKMRGWKGTLTKTTSDEPADAIGEIVTK
jgi:hypothetical protein